MVSGEPLGRGRTVLATHSLRAGCGFHWMSATSHVARCARKRGTSYGLSRSSTNSPILAAKTTSRPAGLRLMLPMGWFTSITACCRMVLGAADAVAAPPPAAPTGTPPAAAGITGSLSMAVDVWRSECITHAIWARCTPPPAATSTRAGAFMPTDSLHGAGRRAAQRRPSGLAAWRAQQPARHIRTTVPPPATLLARGATAAGPSRYPRKGLLPGALARRGTYPTDLLPRHP